MKESKSMMKREIDFMKRKKAPKDMLKHEMKEHAMSGLSLIHISEPTRPCGTSRMPSSA